MKNCMPAFPVPNDASVNGEPGMTLRDYFAAAAMAVIVAGKSEDEGWGLSEANKVYVAHEAYGLADAMLAARDKAR